ncbi:hypothetical protein JW968_05175 [Candidatus Woesearchaeota archaeon]|nr:hypothetical protein [Candidatus Woesearchaeota archaeon]
MRPLVLLISMVLISVVLIPMVFFLACTPPAGLDSSLEKAYDYLSSVHDPDYVFHDDYLKYVYPGERLSCAPGFGEGCILTYRKLDAYFDLVMIRNENPSNPISGLTDEADSHLRALLPVWKDLKISNVIASESREGVALDTLCILGCLYSDPGIAENVLGYLQGDNWMEDDYYSVDKWRNIADESWCILLLQSTGKGPVDELIDVKMKEVDAFLSADNDDLEKAGVMLHLLMIFNEAGGSVYEVERQQLIDDIFNYYSNPSVQDNTLMVSNMLAVLLDAGVPEEDLVQMKDLLVSRQGRNGVFYPFVGSSEDSGQAFTTMRAVIALEKFKLD